MVTGGKQQVIVVVNWGDVLHRYRIFFAHQYSADCIGTLRTTISQATDTVLEVTSWGATDIAKEAAIAARAQFLSSRCWSLNLFFSGDSFIKDV